MIGSVWQSGTWKDEAWADGTWADRSASSLPDHISTTTVRYTRVVRRVDYAPVRRTVTKERS
jgi:hypothetical protein